MEKEAVSRANLETLRLRGLLLIWIGEAWNALEAGAALWSATKANSVALLAFGLDSLAS